MYVSNDYNYEDYEEDPKNGMKEFTEDLDEKHTSTNKNEKKTQNLIKIQITVLITFIILLLTIEHFSVKKRGFPQNQSDQLKGFHYR